MELSPPDAKQDRSISRSTKLRTLATLFHCLSVLATTQLEPMWSEHGIRMQEGSGEDGRREGELFLHSELRTFWTGGTSLQMHERWASPEDSLQEGRKGPEPFQSK